MRITKRQLRNVIHEALELDLEVGDVILAGKFKNKRKIVKDIGKDDLGQLTINGMKALSFRIEKLMPKDKWSKKSKEALEFAEEVNEMKITKRRLKRIVRDSLLESSRAGEAFDEGYSDATQERGLNPRRMDDMDYMQGFEMGEEDIQYYREHAQ
jgi:hypothetical protein